jgi:hypothetical protein
VEPTNKPPAWHHPKPPDQSFTKAVGWRGKYDMRSDNVADPVIGKIGSRNHQNHGHSHRPQGSAQAKTQRCLYS